MKNPFIELTNIENVKVSININAIQFIKESGNHTEIFLSNDFQVYHSVNENYSRVMQKINYYFE